MTWIHSITVRYGLDPKTVRAVVSRISSGRDLLQMNQNMLTQQWNLPIVQAKALLKALKVSTAQADRWVEEGASSRDVNIGGGEGDWSDTDCVLHLTAYFPKILVEGAKTARSSRYPYETPIFVVGGWNRLENLTGVQIPVESKRALLKAVAAKSISYMKYR